MTLPSSGPLSMNDIAGEFGGSTPHALNEYYAGGGLVPAGTSGTYGAVPSSGTISIQNFYGTSNFVPIYIEEVFSTYLYTTNNSTQTITNGINLSANGGLMWFKPRNDGAQAHAFVDSARGNYAIYSNRTLAQDALRVVGGGAGSIALNTNGFSFNGSVFSDQSNMNGGTTTNMVSWTFRKQPKFFDIVTYTGDGTAGRAISHNLGSVPGCVIVKRTDSSADWVVWHRSLSNPSKFLILNSTAVEGTDVNGPWGPFSSGYTTNASAFTSTVFRVANDIRSNASGATYVAYIFAHDAGGFGLTGTDNVITCGSYVGNGLNAGPSINLGYEPQWLLYKNTSNIANWGIIDNMRGWTTAPFYTAGDQVLRPNTSGAEFADDLFSITPTGFQVVGTDPTNNYNGDTYIYIAIRRGPMKTPTTGTSVFAPIAATPSAGSAATTNFPVDMSMMSDLTGASYVGVTNDRLRGYALSDVSGNYSNLFTTNNWTETTFNPGNPFVYGSDNNTGLKWGTNAAGLSDVLWAFRRAPGFFDVVCYNGNGAVSQTISHNLGVTPELIINRRRRNNSGVAGPQWLVWRNSTSAGILNNDEAFDSSSYPAFITSVGATSYSVNNSVGISSLQANLGDPYVTYLFATCPGVSKVGVYTGTGALQTINCGFTGGARFVLIKRMDSGSGFTGLPWYVWDSARGISSSSDPYLRLNTTAAEVTGTNYVDTTSVGFQVTAAAPTSINGSGGSFLFLAIA